jgi:hypothetical protein
MDRLQVLTNEDRLKPALDAFCPRKGHSNFLKRLASATEQAESRLQPVWAKSF